MWRIYSGLTWHNAVHRMIGFCQDDEVLGTGEIAGAMPV
jgi:hypothetical protein